VAESVFGTADVDGFFLEYDTERAGGFEPLHYVPKGKMIGLGLSVRRPRSSNRTQAMRLPG
jgi:5-methyltetrahydropteroyltriglutamate--homocysteine methyltransferase